MAPLADFILEHVPLPTLPHYLTSYVPGKTPLSTPTSVVAALVSYLAVVFGVQRIMKSQPPLRLQFLFQLHNIVLSAGSALLLALMVEEIAPIVWKNGLFYGICNDGAWTPRMEFYYMINYYIKYLELLDTAFLAAKKKPLAFLHVFHHSATALLCFTQLNGRTSVSWVPITLNLTVHVFMYYYYYATAGGARIWWKKYLTTMQIVQFIIDLFAVYFGTYSYFVSTYWSDKFPSYGTCAGTEGAALFGCGLLTSYLGLFINFYIQTYKKPVKGKKPIANGNGAVNGFANGSANGHANGSAKANGIANGKAD
ncbi:GNS1/SUR4 membrane protein [Fomitiporia mediterranea MF3/22]|uniref:GNS1/SUR4 membrane protein n=1 Tax=Fomitiporia mediterranea (strain MF3/22) TaxID=694068 RepID=UPI000440783F|nr:GNS1/SUR4 membrane protein [Fomitiporia mediterranea MF3/22]EJD03957.1 GNS1/SUR4 membrane protein [Fomitiporia mediterranea MF3/22]